MRQPGTQPSESPNRAPSYTIFGHTRSSLGTTAAASLPRIMEQDPVDYIGYCCHMAYSLLILDEAISYPNMQQVSLPLNCIRILVGVAPSRRLRLPAGQNMASVDLLAWTFVVDDSPASSSHLYPS